eukprot:1369402-Rhodomonas_salina.1
MGGGGYHSRRRCRAFIGRIQEGYQLRRHCRGWAGIPDGTAMPRIYRDAEEGRGRIPEAAAAAMPRMGEQGTRGSVDAREERERGHQRRRRCRGGEGEDQRGR